MSAEQIYTREELFTRQRLMIWSAALVVALGVGVFTIVIGRKEAVMARAQKEAEQEQLVRQRAVEEEKAQQHRSQAEQEAEKARFNDYVKTLSNIPGLKHAAGRGYIRGKLVVIDKDEGGVDAIHGAISDDLTANRASEVGTVVWIKRGKVPAAKLYIAGVLQDRTYIHTYTVTVIDMTTKTIVASRLFKNSEPTSDPDEYGLYELYYYLLDLPRR